MAYFDDFPDILLPSFTEDRNSNFDFVKSKNLFKRAKIRDDFWQNATVFDQYSITGDDRPDNVAQKIYNDSDLDWVILIANNVINIRDEWPMSQYDLNRYLDNKYAQDQLSEIHHYETKKIIGKNDLLLLEEGHHVDENFTLSYSYDNGRGRAAVETISGANIVTSVSYYQNEINKNDDKRTIYLVRPEYLETVFADMREIMTYTNSSQYINRRMKKGANLRILSPR